MPTEIHLQSVNPVMYIADFNALYEGIGPNYSINVVVHKQCTKNKVNNSLINTVMQGQFWEVGSL